jgi:hypothetical protein
MLTSFYQAFAPTSFTLLGLWLIVVRRDTWSGGAARSSGVAPTRSR